MREGDWDRAFSAAPYGLRSFTSTPSVVAVSDVTASTAPMSQMDELD
jgi:hypothetical protein